MNKLDQIKHLIQSVKSGLKNEIESMIQDISTSEVFEHHILDDFENGVYNKLTESEIDDILLEVEKNTYIKIELINLSGTF
jgi:hypothetical protein